MKKALGNLEFLVVQDLFLTETAKFADVILPAACYAEKDGTFTNTERRVKESEAVEARRECREDWKILIEVAQRLGAKGFDYKDQRKYLKKYGLQLLVIGGINYKKNR